MMCGKGKWTFFPQRWFSLWHISETLPKASVHTQSLLSPPALQCGEDCQYQDKVVFCQMQTKPRTRKARGERVGALLIEDKNCLKDFLECSTRKSFTATCLVHLAVCTDCCVKFSLEHSLRYYTTQGGVLVAAPPVSWCQPLPQSVPKAPGLYGSVSLLLTSFTSLMWCPYGLP